MAEKKKQLQVMQEMHKDDPKLTEFITESISLNDQLLQHMNHCAKEYHSGTLIVK